MFPFSPPCSADLARTGGATTGGPTVALLDLLARSSTRPRYAFMLLSLIAEVARADGSAGPTVYTAAGPALLRDWLCDGLTPMGGRDPRRLALIRRTHDELAARGLLPADPAAAHDLVEAEVRDRVRASGKTNLSRAISEMVAAGLIRRHYQGYRIDHTNRGAQRHAVYTLAGAARGLLPQAVSAPSPASIGAKALPARHEARPVSRTSKRGSARPVPPQGELAFP